MISAKKFLISLQHALAGLGFVFQREHSFRLQVLISLLVVLLGIFVRLSAIEWIVVLVLIAAVLTMELLNSILEHLLDTLKPRLHPVLHDLKDMMAAAVLIVALAAGLVGLLIFYPYILGYFLS